jgi:excisionase family DNA binding protein
LVFVIVPNTSVVRVRLIPFPVLYGMTFVDNEAGISQLLVPHEMAKPKDVVRPLLDIRAAANRLGCSERFVRRLVQERRIPFIKLGGTRVRFMNSDLDHWIAAQRVEAKR